MAVSCDVIPLSHARLTQTLPLITLKDVVDQNRLTHKLLGYSPAAGTTYITFDNVKVPVENLLGEENKGIHVILSNFNHERWMMACAVIRMSRLVTEECMKWSNQRLVFGKKLIEQPVIRQKYAYFHNKNFALS